MVEAWLVRAGGAKVTKMKPLKYVRRTPWLPYIFALYLVGNDYRWVKLPKAEGMEDGEKEPMKEKVDCGAA